MKLADPEKCTGCTACRAACAFDAIEMTPDEYGFLRPSVDAAKCKNCGVCTRACPLLRDQESNLATHCFAARTNDRDLLLNSSSGGIFTELAQKILASQGVVFGCVLKKNTAIHTWATSLEEVAAMRGSKYVQSDPRDSFRKCRECLRTGRPVMYTGTPCQIAGLKAFLGDAPDNLITVALICHGAASPAVLKEYLQEEGSRQDDTVEVMAFRDKKFVPGRSKMVLRSLQSPKTYLWDSYARTNIYMRSFLAGYSNRECCFNCAFRSGRAGADIVIGDFWNVENVMSGFSTLDGVSAVLIYTVKGQALFDQLSVKKSPAQYEDISRYNYNLDHNTAVPAHWSEFLELMKRGGSLYDFFKRLDYVPIWCRALNFSLRIVRKIIRTMKVRK